MKSLMSNDKKCWVCGTDRNIHKHHVFSGNANRRQSEKWGCWVYLCGRHHNLSNEGVHFNRELDRQLKEICQRLFEEKYSHEEFMEAFGKNFL